MKQDQVQPSIPNNMAPDSGQKDTKNLLSTIDLENLKKAATALFLKFKSNKLIFWPVTIFCSLVLLIVITGLLFGRRQPVAVITRPPSPVPFVLGTPASTPGTGILFESATKLQNSKKGLDEFDVKQGKLKPLDLNFEVRF